MKDPAMLLALAAGLSAGSPYRRERLQSIYPPEPGQGKRKAKAKTRAAMARASRRRNRSNR